MLSTIAKTQNYFVASEKASEDDSTQHESVKSRLIRATCESDSANGTRRLSQGFTCLATFQKRTLFATGRQYKDSSLSSSIFKRFEVV